MRKGPPGAPSLLPLRRKGFSARRQRAQPATAEPAGRGGRRRRARRQHGRSRRQRSRPGVGRGGRIHAPRPTGAATNRARQGYPQGYPKGLPLTRDGTATGDHF